MRQKKSLLRSLQVELAGAGPRVYGLILGPVRTRARAAAGHDDARWYSAEQLGAHCAELIAGTSPDCPGEWREPPSGILGGAMLFTLSTTAVPATDLGYVLREPLRRTHEAVFAVLALESEPVDPRL